MKERDFYEKGKGNNYLNREKIICISANKLSYSLAIPMAVTDYQSIIINP